MNKHNQPTGSNPDLDQFHPAVRAGLKRLRPAEIPPPNQQEMLKQNNAELQNKTV